MLSSSVEIVGQYVTACPHTSITFTCTANQVSSLTWFALPHLDEDDTIVIFASQSPHSKEIDDIFNVSLVAVENMSGHSADLKSTLTVNADGVTNGTNVSCLVFSETRSIIILKEGWLTEQSC